MALRRVALEDPSTFVRAVVALIPKQLSGPEDGPHVVEIRWKEPDSAVAEPSGS
jgi:hypothetical protein